ncbi:hypothetical protein [Daejeonella sp.]|uniref:hypothetical protein n=1 Tax=Daejeonella sp. TaxID=2805397 RepID=UPI00272F901E|nr:hypothetical protein [Daejeonella sp.]MDP2412338.1 hypothetical protein [Daejeonella sp.]
MKRKYFAISAGLIALITVILSLRPVPILAEKDCLVLKGTVLKIYESGVKDVVIELSGNNQKFYVNRGLQRGLNLKELQAKLTGSEIILKYPDHWTPLDPGKSIIHISKIEHEGQTVFTELN